MNRCSVNMKECESDWEHRHELIRCFHGRALTTKQTAAAERQKLQCFERKKKLGVVCFSLSKLVESVFSMSLRLRNRTGHALTAM